MDTPFEIGKTYWMPTLRPENIQVPCPICYGNKSVSLILGNGEQVVVECEGCGLGYEGARGFVGDYSYEAGVKPFTVAGVESMNGDDWWLRSEQGSTARWKDLEQSEALGLEQSKRKMRETLDGNMYSQTARSKHARNHVPWTVRYHEDCIREIEKKIAWHRSKVSERSKRVNHGL